MSKLIYVLEDNEVTRNLLKLKLNSDVFDCEVEVFSTATSLLNTSKIRKPDVVVIDFFLQSNVTAPSVIRALRVIDSKIIIIGISEDVDPKTAIMIIRAGANNYVPKSDLNFIIRTIRDHLRIRAKTTNEDRLHELVAIYDEKSRERLMSAELVSISKLIRDKFVEAASRCTEERRIKLPCSSSECPTEICLNTP